MARPEKILPLTSLRFFAAVAIVFHHYFAFSFPTAAANRWVLPLVGYSAVAVFFFFVLSGYILGYIYLKPNEPVDRRKFYVSRFARIYPLHIVTILVSVPGLFFARLPRWGLAKAALGTAATLTTHVLLIQHWIPQLGSLNYPSWSISSEAFFYLVFPWLGFWLWRRSMAGTLSIGALWFVLSWTVFAIGKTWPTIAIVPHAMPLFEVNLFVTGIVLARAHEALLRSASGNAWLVRWGGALAALAIVVFLVFTERKAALPFGPVHDAFAALLFLCIILGFASGNPCVQWLFDRSWLVVLGESSYGLYLLHAPLYEILMDIGLRPSHLFFLLYLAGAVTLSVLSFYFFETPARSAILRHFSTRSRETVATSSLSQ